MERVVSIAGYILMLVMITASIVSLVWCIVWMVREMKKVIKRG